MTVTLQVVGGPATGLRLHVPSGESRLIGRSPDADFSVPDDLMMSGNHCRVEQLGDQCRLTDVGSTNGTVHNGQYVTEAVLSAGDRVLAGQTEFLVEFGAASNGPPHAVRADAGAAPDLPATYICDGLTLTDEAAALLTPEQSVPEFLTELRSQELFADALRVQAKSLPAPAAVAWGVECMQEHGDSELAEPHASALSAAASWAAAPSPEAALAAREAAEKCGSEGPAAMLAMAAAWAQPSSEESGAAPDPQLPAQAIAGALMLIAVVDPPEAANKYAAFLDKFSPT